MKYQLRVNTTGWGFVTERVHDDEEERDLRAVFWGVRDNDNLGINRPRAIDLSACRILGAS